MLRTLVVDDDLTALHYFKKVSAGIAEMSIEEMFTAPIEALNYLKQHSPEVDLAVLDVNMPAMDGMSLAFQMRQINPNILIVFITAEESFAANMIRIQPDGILFKPYMKQELETCINKVSLIYDAKRSLGTEEKETTPEQTRVFFRTFGRFEVFLDGKLLPLRNQKVKELMALFVEANGGTVASEYAISMLWEDRIYDASSQALYRVTLSKMKKELEKYGIGDILLDYGREKAFDVKKYSSDLQLFMKGDAKTIDTYRGEYMSNYSWAESTLGMLDNMYYSYRKKRSV